MVKQPLLHDVGYLETTEGRAVSSEPPSPLRGAVRASTLFDRPGRPGEDDRGPTAELPSSAEIDDPPLHGQLKEANFRTLNERFV
jgi:hypothetical protein